MASRTDPSAGSDMLDELRRHDPDRFLALLFMAPPARDTAMAVLALQHELQRTPQTVSQPMLGLIRLQWWQEALAEAAETGRAPANAPPILHALLAAQDRAPVPLARLEAMILAQEAVLEREADANSRAGLEAELAAEETPLLLALWDIADPRPVTPAVEAALASLGLGAGLSARLLAMPALLRRGELPLPPALLAEAGVDAEALLAGKADIALLPRAVKPLAEAADRAADSGFAALRSLPGAPPALLLWRSLVRERLARLRRCDFQPLDSRLTTPGALRPLQFAWDAWRWRGRRPQ